MAILIETPRLLMKEVAEEDAQNLFYLNSDPEVIRYTGDKSLITKPKHANSSSVIKVFIKSMAAAG